jgi:hypothetical protein
VIETTSQEARFNWRLPLYAAAGTSFLFLPFVLSSADFGGLVYVFVAAPIVSLVLIGFAIRKKGHHRLSVLSMLVVYWAVSVALVENYSAVRDATRWFLWSKAFQAQVLVQPVADNGGLRHTVWDSWGFAGENTVVYLVFDPDDSLKALPRNRPPGRIRGIPCAVPRIRRLQSHWYAVMFYTDTDWQHCS